MQVVAQIRSNMPPANVITIDPYELARRLGISRDRLTIEIMKQPDPGMNGLMMFSLFVDGKDLTLEQERIANHFLTEKTGCETKTLKQGQA